MAKGYDYARYDSFVGLGETIDGKYITDSTISKDKTTFFYSGSKAPTGVTPVRNAIWLDYDAKKLYVGSNILKVGDSGSWVALV